LAKLQQIVGFRVGKENFGVPIGIVHEIVEPSKTMSLPLTPMASTF
jgi:chemotaxis signal transduction protein